MFVVFVMRATALYPNVLVAVADVVQLNPKALELYDVAPCTAH